MSFNGDNLNTKTHNISLGASSNNVNNKTASMKKAESPHKISTKLGSQNLSLSISKSPIQNQSQNGQSRSKSESPSTQKKSRNGVKILQKIAEDKVQLLGDHGIIKGAQLSTISQKQSHQKSPSFSPSHDLRLKAQYDDALNTSSGLRVEPQLLKMTNQFVGLEIQNQQFSYERPSLMNDKNGNLEEVRDYDYYCENRAPD